VLLASLPRLDLNETEAWRLERGQMLARIDLADGDYRVYAAGRLIGVGHADDCVLRARRLLATGGAASAPAESLES
jgi:hypothetical protein